MPTQLLEDEKALPISYTESKPPEKIDAIFIKDIGELCGIDRDSEEVTEEEVKALIHNINNILAENKVPSFIDVPLEDYDRVITMTDVHILDGTNHIKILLSKQRNETYDFLAFLEECDEKKCENLHLGGVYGRACVWDRARRMAKNIYSKQLGDHHPNIRFHVKDDPIFENAIINPAMTQGYFGESSEADFQVGNPTFNSYLKFDTTKQIEISEADNETFAEESDSYLLQNPNDGFYDKNYKLHQNHINTKNHEEIFKKINAEMLKVESNLTSEEKTPVFSNSSNSSSNSSSSSSSSSSRASSISSSNSSSSSTSTSSAQIDLNFLNSNKRKKLDDEDKGVSLKTKKKKDGK